MRRVAAVAAMVLLVPAVAMAILVPAVAAAKVPVVAVFNVELNGLPGMDAGTADRFSSLLSGRLAASGEFEVVPRSQVKARLQDAKRETFKECYDQACQIELGREMAADKSVSAEVLRLGGNCTVNLAIYDLARATTEAAVTAEGPCTEAGVVETMKGASDRLVEKWRAKAGAPSADDRVPAKAATRDPAREPARGASVPANARPLAVPGVSDAQWKSLVDRVGAGPAQSVAADFHTGGRDVDSFWDFARTRWTSVRDDGRVTAIAGVALVGVAAIVGGALMGVGSYGGEDSTRWGIDSSFDGWTDDDRKAVSGRWILTLGCTLGATLAIVGGSLWGVYQGRLDGLAGAKGAGGKPATALRWTGIAPFHDPLRGTSGAMASFAF